jgi:flagellar motor switch protein FliG
MLKEEMEMLGGVRKSMVDDSQEKIMATLAKLEKEGALVVNRGEE